MKKKQHVSLAEMARSTGKMLARGDSDHLNEGAAPTLEDLAQSLHFSPGDGRIWLNGHRMQLMHTASLGDLRREMVSNLGLEKARGLLTRVGYSAGMRDAQLLRERWPDADHLTLFAAGPRMHALEGAVKVEPVHFEFDVDRGTYHGEFLWHHSSEDEMHIAHFGIGTEPACWTQTGYAIGYTSALVGRLIVYREVECMSMGHRQCRLIGKPADEWDDVEDDLSYLNAEAFVGAGAFGARRPASSRDTAVVFPAAAGAGRDKEMVGVSSAFNAACHMLRRVAPTEATVLFTGESGVGKEVFASMLHRISARAQQSFIAVNCAAIPETLIESELFGVERGAYTGATDSRPGRFERASGGTLFLDEIGTLSLVAQGKLLRALQEGEIERVGGTRSLRVNVRVVAATNVNLREEVRQGRFREDLFFRLNVFPIHLPPLRDRRDDIPLLMSYFLRHYSDKHKRRVTGFTARAADAMLRYPFPGNIRELQNLVERGTIYADEDGPIDLPHLFTSGEQTDPSYFSLSVTGRLQQAAEPGPVAAGAAAAGGEEGGQRLLAMLPGMLNNRGGAWSLDQLEHTLIEAACAQAGGNLSAAARALGLTRPQLAYRLKKRQEQAAGPVSRGAERPGTPASD
ncbi:sigma-54-dependent Fis family transcriptional regulator [Pseudoduganella namucuonensis]|uniref:Regulatory protein, Fis family n=1 Tax=Pseudoduganella namucuonensis TaxID=1035707 RepID=A0A1I7L7B7_9BURK|nr:sigma-54-dependent Fis family transcriptional regulator [Pseudoduganella namucuonensis]SFV05593.1 regulatory protein, Fis family [Pseudoduganella namucuonensis]